MTYKIEKDVPISPQSQKGKCPLREALRAMEIGDSILITRDDKNYSRVGGAINHFYRCTDMRFSKRKVQEGIRIWRVELCAQEGK